MVYVLLAMLFFHVLDDFCLQSCWLVNGKQRSWWEENAPNPLYKNDYLMALFMHAFSWTFSVTIPLVVAIHANFTPAFWVAFVLNVICHARIDHIKANKKTINLIQDQLCHLIQIGLTWFWIGVIQI